MSMDWLGTLLFVSPLARNLLSPVPHSYRWVACFFPAILSLTFYFFLKPFTNRFPRADINELISPDLLHQLIKGTFKDHLVTWVNDYIKAEYPESVAQTILVDIDRRY